jgi:predicted transcriptional regulator
VSGKETDGQIRKNTQKQKRKTNLTQPDPIVQKIWDSITRNYALIQGAQLSNSFIILMALSEAKEPLNTTQISQAIALNTKGQIYKISATLKDSLEHRLKREGYVEGIDKPNKTLYSITPKGRKLLQGWIAFLSPYS